MFEDKDITEIAVDLEEELSMYDIAQLITELSHRLNQGVGSIKGEDSKVVLERPVEIVGFECGFAQKRPGPVIRVKIDLSLNASVLERDVQAKNAKES
jgi:hypothetical protein